MALIAGIDIGNATTEVALAELSAGATPVFVSSSIVPTTGIKGTAQNTQGVFQALTIALDAAGRSLSELDLIRITEAAPVIGDEIRPLSDETKTIRPFTGRSFAKTAWVTATWPTTLISNWRRRSASEIPSIGPPTTTPALLTTASNVAGNASSNAATWSASVLSSTTAVTCPRIDATSAGPLSAGRR